MNKNINFYDNILKKYTVKNYLNKELVIYTVIFNNYDELKKPKSVDNDIEYICFTDNKYLKSEIWKIIYVSEEENSILLSRLFKIKPHIFLKEYKESIFIDGSITILNNFYKFVKENFCNKNIVLFEHPKRKCIYKEAKACIYLKKEKKDRITNQIKFYKNDKYPKNNGLVATGIIYRRHKKDSIIELMNFWFNQVLVFSFRDQISFNYSCYKLNVKYNDLKINIFKNPYFIVKHHNINNFNIIDYIKYKLTQFI